MFPAKTWPDEGQTWEGSLCYESAAGFYEHPFAVPLEAAQSEAGVVDGYASAGFDRIDIETGDARDRHGGG